MFYANINIILEHIKYFFGKKGADVETTPRNPFRYNKPPFKMYIKFVLGNEIPSKTTFF